MGYSKEITQEILKCYARGLTAHETVQFFKEKRKMKIGVQTIYRHRKNLTAAILIEEMLRNQKRDISDAPLHLRLKYRDKLLEKLLPHMYKILAKREKKVTIDLEKFNKELWSIVTSNRKS